MSWWNVMEVANKIWRVYKEVPYSNLMESLLVKFFSWLCCSQLFLAYSWLILSSAFLEKVGCLWRRYQKLIFTCEFWGFIGVRISCVPFNVIVLALWNVFSIKHIPSQWQTFQEAGCLICLFTVKLVLKCYSYHQFECYMLSELKMVTSSTPGE